MAKSADDLAFLRDAWDFRNVLLVEVPNGDFRPYADAPVPVRCVAFDHAGDAS